METFTPQEKRDLKTVFDVYDPVKNGCITVKDFRKVYKLLSPYYCNDSSVACFTVRV